MGPKSEEVFFSVDARHIRQLGRELVGDRITAVSELVKNAYDADATQVAVAFGGDDASPHPQLTIRDDGSGMSFDELLHGWMRISTSAKDVDPVSPLYGRPRAGRKGIGRFATESLGDELELRTTVRGDETMLVVSFDWTRFTAGEELSRIGSSYRVEQAASESHGSEFVVRKLHHSWGPDDMKRIHDALLLLQPPFPVAHSTEGDSDDPGFAVTVTGTHLEAGGASDERLSAFNDFIGAATAMLRVEVTDNAASVHVRSERLDLNEVLPLPFPQQLGPMTAEAAYFVYRQDALGDVKTRMAQAMGRGYGGVRVYRDGLRVMPYGEPGVDWLGLDEMQGSRSGTLVAIRSQNWFGQVLIGRESNPNLIDTASREGFVQNEAYDELRDLLQNALVRGAERVAAARGRKPRTDAKVDTEVASRRDILSDTKRDLLTRVTADLSTAASDELKTAIEQSFVDATRDAAHADSAERNARASLAGEVDLLRILASLGTSIAVFSHEVQGVVDHAAAAYAVLRTRVVDDIDGEIAGTLAAAEDSLERMSALATYINSYVSVSQRRDREEQPLYAVIESFVEQLSSSLARGVDIKWRVAPRALRTEPMTRSELETILINFLTNAVKAMNQEGWADRRIDMSAEGIGAQVVLRFQDSGIGVEPAIRESIFDAFVSDTRKSVSALGIGTGLGLKIVSDIADAYGGSVALAEPDAGFTTCLRLTLPRWSKQVRS